MRVPPFSESIAHARYNWGRFFPDTDGTYPGGPSYFLCHTGRAGSTWTGRHLSALPGLGRPSEYLIPAMTGAARQRSGSEYLHTVAESQGKPWGMRTDYTGAVPLLDAGAFVHEERLYVYLTREDHTAQAHSLYRAIASGIWHTGKRTERDPAIEHAAAFRDALEWIEEQEDHWEGLWRRTGIEPFRVTYEALLSEGMEPIVRYLREGLG